MLNLREDAPLNMLRQFAVNLDADVIEDFGASKLILKNEHGNGTVSLYEVFPGLTAWVYNITFKKDYKIDLQFSEDRPIYFGYHVSGYQNTKFKNEDDYKKIEQGQNFIIMGSPNTHAEFVIPAEVHFQSCYIIVHPHLLGKQITAVKKRLETSLEETFGWLENTKHYRYFGKIDVKSGIFADILLNNERTDLVGRLLTEAALKNLLASQMDSHDQDQRTENFQPELSQEELARINGLGDYIREHISEKFNISDYARKIRVSPKKLQLGIRFLYGYSVNNFITNMRLGIARELIHSTDMSISEICYHVGYSSRSYLSKIFYERFGILPNDYKNAFKKDDLLFEVSYRSMASKDLKSSDVDEILKMARSNNSKFGITGSLIFHRNVFFQLIEGPKNVVLRLYDNIKKDKRHFDVDTLWQGAKPNRDFSNWSMAMLSDSGILSIPQQGDTKELSLEHLMKDVGDQSILSQNLWRKVRNIIKTRSAKI